MRNLTATNLLLSEIKNNKFINLGTAGISAMRLPICNPAMFSIYWGLLLISVKCTMVLPPKGPGAFPVDGCHITPAPGRVPAQLPHSFSIPCPTSERRPGVPQSGLCCIRTPDPPTCVCHQGRLFRSGTNRRTLSPTRSPCPALPPHLFLPHTSLSSVRGGKLLGKGQTADN